jgi:Tol biopolymer transport system component
VTRTGFVRALMCAGLAVSGLTSLTASGAAPAGRTTLLSASIVNGKASTTGSVMATAVSSDGNYIAFDDDASDLVVGDTNAVTDVFEYNRLTRALTRVSVSSQGIQGVSVHIDPSDPNHPLPLGSVGPAVSANGRFVAFTSDDVNLVTADTNNVADIFVHDIVTKKTERVSVATGGGQANDESGEFISISGDGRYVAFVSKASNLVANDTNGVADLFVHDRTTNVTRKITGTAGVGAGYIAMSQDGRYVAYPVDSAAGTVQPKQLWVYDLKTGASKRGDLLEGGRVPTPTPPASGAWLMRGGLSATGRYILFSSGDKYVPTRRSMSTIPGVAGYEVYRHDFVTGHTLRVTVTSAGEERDGGVQGDGTLSPDGRFAVFATHQQFDAPTNSPCVLCGTLTVYTHDCDTYVTTAQSWTYDDKIAGVVPGEVNDPGNVVGEAPAISSGGRYVSFASNAVNPLPGDPGVVGEWNAYLRDRGLPRGVGEIAVANSSGFARTGVLARTDSSTDVTELATARGANLDGAALISRPALRDILIRLQIVQMPSFDLADPSILYAMDLRAGGASYEVRAQKVGLSARFALFRKTAAGWAHVADLQGGYGTTGDEVVAAVPLRSLGDDNGPLVLTDITAVTGVGTLATGMVTTLDSVALQRD